MTVPACRSMASVVASASPRRPTVPVAVTTAPYAGELGSGLRGDPQPIRSRVAGVRGCGGEQRHDHEQLSRVAADSPRARPRRADAGFGRDQRDRGRPRDARLPASPHRRTRPAATCYELRRTPDHGRLSWAASVDEPAPALLDEHRPPAVIDQAVRVRLRSPGNHGTIRARVKAHRQRRQRTELDRGDTKRRLDTRIAQLGVARCGSPACTAAASTGRRSRERYA